jgi:hypothetical protein
VIDSTRALAPIPAIWCEFLARSPQSSADWTFHDTKTAYQITFDEGEFLVLAERAGDQFVLHRMEPPASTLFYLNSHDAKPSQSKGF